MVEIRLQSIIKDKNRVTYDFSYSDEIALFFSGKSFQIEYPEVIEGVPDSILAVPFLASTLPICWLMDGIMSVPEIDKDFFEAISNIKNGYKKMYPNAQFAGRIEYNKIVENRKKCEKVALFFSGGVDATTSLLRHIEEKPMLITLWGSDVGYNNQEAWNIVDKGIEECSEQYKLPRKVIRTTFREFDDEGNLTRFFIERLGDNWWHGIKHGIAIICHAAPLVWLYSLNKLYFASTHCPEDGKVTCASYPTIDNNVAFCGCKAVHDGFELSRQNKIQKIVEFKKNHPDQIIYLRVCWKSQEGNNCCRCEKCYRTIAGFLAEGADPKEYGFDFELNKKSLEEMYRHIALQCNEPLIFWNCIKERLNKNWKNLQDFKYRNQIAWIKKYDFDYPSNNACRKKYVFKGKLKRKIRAIIKRLCFLRGK